MLKKEEMITLLKNDVVPALGCTEPVCVALCAANAGKMTENKIRSIEVEVNAGIYKNGMSAGIPGCDYVGLPYAAALGAYLKNPEKGLELLEDITPEILEQMKELCGMAAVSVKIKEQEQGLYVKCKIKTEADMITSVIRGTHTNLVYLEKNGKIIYEKNQENGQASDNALIEALKQMTIAQIRQVADTASAEELHFLMDGVEMNERLAAYSGAGTKGLVVILPVSEAADALGVSMEKKVRALAIAHLVNRYINAYIGKLSPMCSCVMASSTAASVGIAYLLGGSDEQLGYAVRNMSGTVTGMICDGGKVGCAMKVATGSSAALLCALTAVHDAPLRVSDGICAETPEDCIRHMAQIGNQGMAQTDKEIIHIMEQKK